MTEKKEAEKRKGVTAFWFLMYGMMIIIILL